MSVTIYYLYSRKILRALEYCNLLVIRCWGITLVNTSIAVYLRVAPPTVIISRAAPGSR